MKTTEEYAYQLSLELFKNCETFKEKEAAIEEAWNLAMKFTTFGTLILEYNQNYGLVDPLPNHCIP
ncbi:hypothetical protein [Acinetobacter baumannii]|uniref:hypothetical protein n=1 Tax=Acinetobacter baumannii TaxID=470 RepID=UPI0001E2B6E0|nr:hypothetical protein [Acinetobacter baumannii]AJF82898.1 hypothetical protein ABA1_03020 [Acinetobacter baumannii]EHU2437079.1 hypothetical protein [Acinetobacter baumannii]EKV1867412.1 hypothetical protein [Acinetobacter baumannii]EKW8083854.1 hypothetical protein [Acinetobacter baumannii]EKX7069023.1 hypothetical protein [Acinetobacter baumannii]